MFGDRFTSMSSKSVSSFSFPGHSGLQPTGNLFNCILETYSVSLEQNAEVTEIMGKTLDLTSGQPVYTKLLTT